MVEAKNQVVDGESFDHIRRQLEWLNMAASGIGVGSHWIILRN
jgi:hypothetical protein